MRISDWSSDVCSSDLIASVGPAPGIPPLRLLAGLEAQGERLQSRIEIEHVFDQKRIALNETPTDNYTLVNASISFKPLPANGPSLVLSANNIFDVVERRHASFLRSEERRVGQECVGKCRSGWFPYHSQKQPNRY